MTAWLRDLHPCSPCRLPPADPTAGTMLNATKFAPRIYKFVVRCGAAAAAAGLL
jgi:hypothetical protein